MIESDVGVDQWLAVKEKKPSCFCRANREGGQGKTLTLLILGHGKFRDVHPEKDQVSTNFSILPARIGSPIPWSHFTSSSLYVWNISNNNFQILNPGVATFTQLAVCERKGAMNGAGG